MYDPRDHEAVLRDKLRKSFGPEEIETIIAQVKERDDYSLQDVREHGLPEDLLDQIQKERAGGRQR